MVKFKGIGIIHQIIVESYCWGLTSNTVAIKRQMTLKRVDKILVSCSIHPKILIEHRETCKKM